jgi:hypothetical protein
MHVENGVSGFVVGAVHSYSWAYILAGWSGGGGGGELSYMCSQTASRCRFFTSTVRRWLGSSNVFPPSLAILFLSLVVQYEVYTCGSYAALPTSPGSTRRPSQPIYKVAIIFLATSRSQQLFLFPKINIYNNLQKCFNDASNNKKIFYIPMTSSA